MNVTDGKAKPAPKLLIFIASESKPPKTES